MPNFSLWTHVACVYVRIPMNIALRDCCRYEEASTPAFSLLDVLQVVVLSNAISISCCRYLQMMIQTRYRMYQFLKANFSSSVTSEAVLRYINCSPPYHDASHRKISLPSRLWQFLWSWSCAMCLQYQLYHCLSSRAHLYSPLSQPQFPRYTISECAG